MKKSALIVICVMVVSIINVAVSSFCVWANAPYCGTGQTYDLVWFIILFGSLCAIPLAILAYMIYGVISRSVPTGDADTQLDLMLF